MLSIASTPFALAGPAMARVAPVTRAGQVKMETVADLETLAVKCNPILKYYNPLKLGESSAGSLYDTEAAIGYLRHAEIKHGRVAMLAFVGYIVQSNGIVFPWDLTWTGHISHAAIAAAGSPPAEWDALPTNSKLQIFGLIFFLELFSEGFTNMSGEKHYMRGGKAGFFPRFSDVPLPHPVPFNLFDPFNLSKNASPEKKARGLVAEINNGRAAQIGIIAFVSEARVPGSVPALSGLIAPYNGEVMAPFSATDNLPFVKEMLSYTLPIQPWW